MHMLIAKKMYSFFLDDSTQVCIYVREGYSIRLALMNDGPQFHGKMGEHFIFEFYTLSAAGMCA